MNKAQLTRFFLYKALDKTRNVCNQSFKRVSQVKQFLQNLWLHQQTEIHLDSRNSKNMNTLFTKIHFIVKSGVLRVLQSCLKRCDKQLEFCPVRYVADLK